MRYLPSLKRRKFMQWMSGVALGSHALTASGAMALSEAGGQSARLDDAAIRIEFDQQLRSSVSCLIAGVRRRLTGYDSSEFLELADGERVERYTLLRSGVAAIAGVHGAGRCLVVTGRSADGWEKTVRVSLYDRYPGCAVYQVVYRNGTRAARDVKGWTNGAFHIQNRQDSDHRFWSYSGGSYPDRRDWVQPVKAGFGQPNFMGMTGSDYGGGTPIVDVWRRDCGLAVGHLETVPKEVSLPIHADDLRDGAPGRLLRHAGQLPAHDGRPGPARAGHAGRQLRADLVRLGLRARLFHGADRGHAAQGQGRRPGLGRHRRRLANRQRRLVRQQGKIPARRSRPETAGRRNPRGRAQAEAVVFAPGGRSRQRPAARPYRHAAAR